MEPMNMAKVWLIGAGIGAIFGLVIAISKLISSKLREK
jgi:hypothetical protein